MVSLAGPQVIQDSESEARKHGDVIQVLEAAQRVREQEKAAAAKVYKTTVHLLNALTACFPHKISDMPPAPLPCQLQCMRVHVCSKNSCA